MMVRTSSLLGAMAVIAALCACAAAQDNLFVNGDFEDITGWGDPGTSDTPAGWTSKDGRSNAASQQSGADAIGGSGTSAFMGSFPASDPDRRDIQQVFASWPQWQLDFDFASEDPGGADDRSLSGGMLLSDGRISLRVVDVGDDGAGDMQLYHAGSGWQPIAELVGSVTLDPDVSTSPQVNHMTINGRFDEASPVYDITVTNASATAFTATGLSFYQVTPTTGAGVADVNFNTYLSAGDYLVDNFVMTDNRPTVWPPEQYIENGDFEDTTGWGLPGTTLTPPGWVAAGTRKNAAGMAVGAAALGGSGTSAHMEPFVTTDENARREIRQTFALGTSDYWQFDVDIASEAFLSPDDRSLALSLDSLNGGILTVRIVDHDSNGVGDLQIYDGGWASVPELNNSFTLDGDLSFDLAPNHLTIVGDYSGEDPTYAITLTNAGDVEFVATGLTGWLSAAPTPGEGLCAVTFNTFNSMAAYVIDNVSLVDLDSPDPTPGDADGSGFVDAMDAAILAANWQATGVSWGDGDFNDDNVVDDLDATILAANWTGAGSNAAVPEPGALALLAGCLLSGLILLPGLKRRIRL